MGNVTIYPKGTADITVPAGQSIAISNFGGGIAQIYYLITAANAPPAFQFQQTLENSSVTLGAFSAETIVRIEANNSKVIYDVGVSPDTGIGDADTLNGLPSDTTDTAATIAARDSSGDIQANAFESTVATGIAPLTVASTTVNTNLNADLLDNQQGSYYAADSGVVHLAGTETISGTKTFSASPVLNNNNHLYGKDTGGIGRSLVSITSIDKIILGDSAIVTNIQSNDDVSFLSSGAAVGAKVGDLVVSSSYATIAPTNGIYSLGRIKSGVTTGTSPFDVESTTVNSNLNADLLDGQHGSYYAINSGISGSFTTTDGKTVTVTNGVITAIV